jgi:hypothetical protein
MFWQKYIQKIITSVPGSNAFTPGRASFEQDFFSKSGRRKFEKFVAGKKEKKVEMKM